MKAIKQVMTIVAVLIATFGIDARENQSNAVNSSIGYIVEGTVDGLDGKVLYMSDYDNDKIIDSTLIVNGRFQFKGTYDRAAYVMIENGNTYACCVLDSIVVIDFSSHYPSSGSHLTKNLMKLIFENNKLDNELEKFYNELQSHGFEQPELGEIYKHLYDKLRPKRLQLNMQAISENPNGIGEYAVMKLGDLLITSDEWDTIYSSMSPYLKERQSTKHLNDKFMAMRKSEPGKPFIDFDAKTVDGKDVKLSDYVGKGKYVLMDFWASWCGPCREEAEQTLRPLYEKYKDDDRFMILGIATWDEHDKTIVALDKFRYPWTQIIDTGEAPMKLYGFNGIPQIILISPDGTILERDLRSNRITDTVDSILNTKHE